VWSDIFSFQFSVVNFQLSVVDNIIRYIIRYIIRRIIRHGFSRIFADLHGFYIYYFYSTAIIIIFCHPGLDPGSPGERVNCISAL